VDRYYLHADLGGERVEREVTLLEYCRAERAAGFHPGTRREDVPATASWSSGHIGGRVEYDFERKEK
jgi:hypothetical protein